MSLNCTGKKIDTTGWYQNRAAAFTWVISLETWKDSTQMSMWCFCEEALKMVQLYFLSLPLYFLFSFFLLFFWSMHTNQIYDEIYTCIMYRGTHQLTFQQPGNFSRIRCKDFEVSFFPLGVNPRINCTELFQNLNLFPIVWTNHFSNEKWKTVSSRVGL